MIDWDHAELKNQFSKSRYSALMKLMGEENDPRKMRAFWEVLSDQNPKFSEARRVEFYAVVYSTEPGPAHAEVSRTKVWETNVGSTPVTLGAGTSAARSSCATRLWTITGCLAARVRRRGAVRLAPALRRCFFEQRVDSLRQVKRHAVRRVGDLDVARSGNAAGDRHAGGRRGDRVVLGADDERRQAGQLTEAREDVERREGL